jgi:hypothetical protein
MGFSATMTGSTALASAVTLSLVSPLAFSSPLPAPDVNPLLSGFALPAPLPARVPESDEWTWATHFAWGSSAIMQQRTTRETVIVDAETREFSIELSRALGKGFALRLALPYRHTSAGTLDGFIDSWHDFFSLPEGARPALPRDSLSIAYARDGQWLIDERSSHEGIGDVSMQLGKQLGAAPITAWVGLKLPTGDAQEFTGSGSVDVTLALAAERAFGGRYAAFAQVAATYLSEGERMPSLQKDFAWSALAGMSARLFDRVTVTAQVGAHTAVFDSAADFLSDAVTLTVGGTYRIARSWDLSFAVTEDIAVETAPDVVFIFQLGRSVP